MPRAPCYCQSVLRWSDGVELTVEYLILLPLSLHPCTFPEDAFYRAMVRSAR